MSGLRLVGAGYDACPDCGGGLPGEVDDDLVCRCGSSWAGDPWRGVVDWDHIIRMLAMRAGSCCEIRSPECIAGPGGDLSQLPRHRWSIHHRKPRGAGGTSRADVHSLAALVLTCGHGTVGCHWYTEQNPEWAEARGLKVLNTARGDAADPRLVAFTLHSGRRVLLDDVLPHYLPAPGLPYAV